jgi:hypothetical protein
MGVRRVWHCPAMSFYNQHNARNAWAHCSAVCGVMVATDERPLRG